eukprot:2592739-Prymnesium_polylepis.1
MQTPTLIHRCRVCYTTSQDAPSGWSSYLELQSNTPGSISKGGRRQLPCPRAATASLATPHERRPPAPCPTGGRAAPHGSSAAWQLGDSAAWRGGA